MREGIIEEKIVLTSFILILVKGINTDYILDKSIVNSFNEYIQKTKNTSKLTYEVAINDVIEDLNTEADNPKKLNVKLKNDTKSDIYEAFVIKSLNNKSDILKILDSFLDNLK